jgi:hypothetical protein
MQLILFPSKNEGTPRRLHVDQIPLIIHKSLPLDQLSGLGAMQGNMSAQRAARLTRNNLCYLPG